MMSIRGDVLASKKVDSAVAVDDQTSANITNPTETVSHAPRYHIDPAMDCPVLITDKDS